MNKLTTLTIQNFHGNKVTLTGLKPTTTYGELITKVLQNYGSVGQGQIILVYDGQPIKADDQETLQIRNGGNLFPVFRTNGGK